MADKRKIRFVWFCWFLFWPLILWVAYNFYYIQIEGQLFDIFLFSLFMVLVSLFPLTINNNQIFFANGISIVIFLVFGLFVEIVLTQLAILVVLFNAGVRKQDSFRFPLNMLSFVIISLLSAEVYKLLGGTHGLINYNQPKELFAIFGYAFSVYILNQLINKIIDSFFYKRKIKLFGKGEMWELTSLLLVLPVGYVLFVLYYEIGRAAIFYVGIPFVFISIILQLLYSYQELNDYLERTGKIGHKLTKNLEKSEVYDIFIREVTSLIPVDYAYIYMVIDNEQLKLKRIFDSANRNFTKAQTLERKEAFSGLVWESGETLVYNSSKEWKDEVKIQDTVNVESVLSLPIEYDDEVIGVLTVASKRKRMFEKFHVEILDIVTTYFGVAIENAKNLELTKSKSEIDGLTQLYNYYYFENSLKDYSAKLLEIDQYQYFSLLLLDLDHFKRTNDTYGHEAGNEVLRQVAGRLSSHIENEELLARYGGEEFAILLPGADTEDAYQKAQIIRNAIIERPFEVHKHILGTDHPVEVAITASIGIATYPEHCKSLQELIRHADRAMYIGAKNRGRDRVALYEEVITS